MKFYDFQEKENRIDIFDERFYKIGDKFYRNVTTILGIINKGYAFDEWLKNSGHNAELITDRAGRFGTNLHTLIQRFLQGETVSYYNNQTEGERVSTALWERFNIWLDFWRELNKNFTVEYNDENIEKICYCDKYEYAGTLDFVARINGEPTIFDWKSGNYLGNQEKLQMIAYMHMVDVKKAKLIWMPAKKPNKKGYRIIDVDFSEAGMELFLATKKIFDMEHKDKPKVLTLPIETSLQTFR